MWSVEQFCASSWISEPPMPIYTLLVDTEDILYTRPQPDAHLYSYLETQGLQPRHPKVVKKALKAAHFDVLHGRITREDFFNAMLGFYGVTQDALEGGRAALLADAAALEPMPDAIETLTDLQARGVEIVMVANTEHPARDLVVWLAAAGFPETLWRVALTSCELGLVRPDPAFFRIALEITGANPAETAFIGQDDYELSLVMQQGLTALAFQPNNPASVATPYVLHSFAELASLLS
jgi:FMN phosphatase YigB (HAD superfamily)